MTSDALIASFAVLLMIVAWVYAHSALVGGEIADAKLEAKKARVLALTDWTAGAVKDGTLKETGATGNEEFAEAAARFGIEGAKVRTWAAGEGKGSLDGIAEMEGKETVCMRRVVSAGGSASENPRIVEVCA
ncbi:Uncharacterised protein [Candidatus Burarchaeum australiense]|nr:Uncharacterised protein [Candidatus Burarchaeum australiense]